jgi:ribosomal protein L11 methylase PrmA
VTVSIDLEDLGNIEIELAPGGAVTPGTLVTIDAVLRKRQSLGGLVIDWGAGSGALSIVAARVPGVERVIGLELSEGAVATARGNAEANGVGHKVSVIHANGYEPLDDVGRRVLQATRGAVDTIIANPPASVGDDGFAWRRRVLAGGVAFLRSGGIVLLQISRQYGASRVEDLVTIDYAHRGVVATTGWVPWDMSRSDLSRLLEDMAAEEARGGPSYEFGDPDDADGPPISATAALDRYQADAVEPLTQWQVHQFTRLGAP